MKRTRHYNHVFLIIFVATLVIFGAINPRATDAQQGNSPQLRITEVDTSSYPDVTVYVYGRNLGKDFAEVPLIVQQDGVDQVATRSEVVDVGTQLVFLIDSSEDIFKPGKTGDPRYQEVSNVVTRLVERGLFSPSVDWMATYAPAAGETIQSISDWTRDHGKVRNDLYIYEPERGIGETPLNKLIYYGLDSFASPELDPRAQRAMVLFSDGVDNLSSDWIDTATNRANDMNVAIHTVLLGDGTAASRSNLERIAVTTGGQFVQLTSVDALDSLFQGIAGGGAQRLIGYRSTVADPETVAVVAELDGGAREADAPIQAPTLQPARPQIVQPATGTTIERRGTAFDTPLRNLSPTIIPVQVQIDFPDGRQRDIKRVEYSIGASTQVQESEPFGSIELSIEGLGEGDYALRVRAFDDLGLVGEAQPQTIKISEVRPPAPTATPAPTPEPPPPPPLCPPICIPVESPNTSWMAFSALGLALIALLLAIVVFLRKPENRERAAETLTGTIKAMTQPFSIDRRARGPIAAKARLHLFEGGANIPAVIEILGTNTRFGRDPSLSNVVLDDPRVSRYHCRIAEEADGSFRIYDEGSTSGTYVNYEAVDIRGQTLNDGDQIHIGPIGLRFELAKPALSDDSSTKTEPFIPQFGPDAAGDDDDPFKTEPFDMMPPKQE
ncbi:MAG: FHA domain-containing protein [Anaerolineae bacterium]|nr:FHA domain-containing protein [Anaerolineae bacterium]